MEVYCFRVNKTVDASAIVSDVRMLSLENHFRRCDGVIHTKPYSAGETRGSHPMDSLRAVGQRQDKY